MLLRRLERPYIRAHERVPLLSILTPSSQPRALRDRKATREARPSADGCRRRLRERRRFCVGLILTLALSHGRHGLAGPGGPARRCDHSSMAAGSGRSGALSLTAALAHHADTGIQGPQGNVGPVGPQGGATIRQRMAAGGGRYGCLGGSRSGASSLTARSRPDTGIQGPQGNVGATGAKGDTGPQGAPGINGSA